MTATPFCDSCGQYIAALPDDHDEDQCRTERQAEINRRGADRARDALAALKGTPDREDTRDATT